MFKSECYEIGTNGLVKLDKTPVVKINQILETHNYGVTRHVVIGIREGAGMPIYQTINLKTGEYSQKEYIKPLSKMHGIGTYYNDTEPEFMDAIEVAVLQTKADEIKAEQNRQAEETYIENQRLAEIGRERLEKLLPEDMQALIVAQEKENDSDPYTDYYGYTVKRTVILGYSKTKRNDFNEMRKMASRFEGTKHLAEYNKDNEHRENYTGGGGYYLGESRYSGWTISKESYRTRAQFIDTYACLAGKEDTVFIGVPDTVKEHTPTAEPIQANGVKIVDYSEKAIAVYGETKPIKDILSDLGGRFNFRLTIEGEKVAGWVFPKSKVDEVKKALSLTA